MTPKLIIKNKKSNSEYHCWIIEEYCTDYSNYYHNENGPAIINYNKDGSYNESYIIYNEFHREDGPAWIDYDQDKKVILEKFYFKGIKFSNLKDLQIYAKTLLLI